MSILVIGEALIDIVSIAGAEDRYAPGGAPANVALGLGRLGNEVELLTDIGDDFHGGFLLGHLRESRVLVHARAQGTTSTAHAKLGADGSAEYDFALRWNPDASLVERRPYSAMHIGSIAAFLQPGAAVVDSLLAEAASAQTPVLTSFDPNIRPTIIGSHAESLARFEAIASRVDVVKLSDMDANWLYPALTSEEQIETILELGTKLVALTQGSQGSILSTASARTQVSAELAEVRDTIGAGDSFMVSLVHDLHGSKIPLLSLDGPRLADLGANAARLAAITVSRVGADLPWTKDI